MVSKINIQAKLNIWWKVEDLLNTNVDFLWRLCSFWVPPPQATCCFKSGWITRVEARTWPAEEKEGRPDSTLPASRRKVAHSNLKLLLVPVPVMAEASRDSTWERAVWKLLTRCTCQETDEHFLTAASFRCSAHTSLNCVWTYGKKAAKSQVEFQHVVKKE